MIYFDNAATSGSKPDCVIDALNNILRNVNANPGRSGHALALKAAETVAKAREKAAAFFNAPDSDYVVFTQNCTDSLNLAINGLALCGHVITTVNEHNSVLRPLHMAERRGQIKLTVLPPGRDGGINAAQVAAALRRDTVLIAVNHVSNVTGAISDIAGIGAVARKAGVLFLTDAAQSGGHLPIDMQRMNIDMLALAPHKGFCAVQGLGVLLFNKRCSLRPVRYGGTGTESENVYQPQLPPEAFESGTVATPAIAAFMRGMEYLEENPHRAEAHKKLSRFLHDGLSKIPGVALYSPAAAETGVLAFNIRNLTSTEVSDILDSEYEICVRPGLHCAPLIHRHLGTGRQGLVRASVCADNTIEEGEFFLNAVSEIASL